MEYDRTLFCHRILHVQQDFHGSILFDFAGTTHDKKTNTGHNLGWTTPTHYESRHDYWYSNVLQAQREDVEALFAWDLST